MKNEQWRSSGKILCNTQLMMHPANAVPYILLLGLGLVLGIALTSFLQQASYHTTSSSFQFNQFISTLNSTLPSSPVPAPPPPPKQSAPLNATPPGRVGLREFLRAPAGAGHDMGEEELRWRASMAPRIRKYPFRRAGKVAFLFLARGALPLAPLWEIFFRGNEGRYSIYIHSNPSFAGSAAPEGSVFHGRNVPSKEVAWGQFSMVDAERRLLANALLDMTNQRFVLLSESCIPLYNFSTIYSYLMNSTKSFVEVYDLPGPVGRGRYNPRMRPLVTLQQWRKGSQWFEMERDLAIEVISDERYSRLFRRLCKPACYSDEHYLPTLVNMKFPARNWNRSLTWVDWSRGGPHPGWIKDQTLSMETLNRVRYGKICQYNGGRTNMCFLFARKVAPDALNGLLKLASSVMGFGSDTEEGERAPEVSQTGESTP